MKRLLWSLLLVCLELSVAQPVISSIQFLPELLGVDNPRFPLLSPDGSTIFYQQDNTLCFFSIDVEATQCHDYAETFGGFGRYSMPVWSPDSRRVLFTESFFDMFRESDLWQLEATTGEYTNLTDDGIDRMRIGDEDPATLIDYLPTFSPSGELYFFRSRPTSGINEVLGPRFSLELFKLTETLEAVRVSSLRPQLPIFAVSQPAVISPDGKRIAFIVAPPTRDDPTAGIWVQDLATGKREQVLSLTGLPETRPGAPSDRDAPMSLTQLAWADLQHLIVYAQSYTDATPMRTNAFYLELDTSTVTPFENLSSLSTADLYKDTGSENPMASLPITGFVTPDGQHYIYAGGFSGTGAYFLWSRSLPLKNEPAKLLGALSHDETSTELIPGGFGTATTLSTDGKRALVLGYLLMLE
jgi:WD40-like Beta Propeller Repeat